MFCPQWREVEPNAIYNRNDVRLVRPQGRQAAQEDRAGQSVRHDDTRKGNRMGRIFKALIFLVVIGFIGLTAYAYLGDLAPVQGEVKQPVVLNAD
jgi:hypothetical protein